MCPVPVINEIDLSLPAKNALIEPTTTDLWVYENTISGLMSRNLFVISKILLKVK